MTFAVLLVVGVAYLISIALMPLIGRTAVHHKLLDKPDDIRRRHERPIPRLGGVAVFLSVLVMVAAGAAIDDRAHLLYVLPFVASIAIGATILFVVGLVDDIVGVRPLGKLIAQSTAAIIVWYAGFRLDVIMLTPSHQISLGLLGLPITVLWIVGLSNAFNLVDGADGLAGGVAVVALVSTAIAATIVHDPTVLWCSLALIGAMLGFLRFNWPPARIFLGDSGSLVVGFLLAVLTVKGASTRTGAVYFLAPIFALSYPLLDTGISMLRRWLRAEPLSRADGRHIHHQLQTLGVGPRQSVLLICGLSAVIAALGLSATFAPPEFTFAIAIAGAAVLVLIFVYGLRWLQYNEFLVAGASLGAAAMRGRSLVREKILASDVALLLRDAPDFESLTKILDDSMAQFRFVHVELQGRSDVAGFGEPAQVQAHAAPTWKLEYPITRMDSTLAHPIFLSIWCPLECDGAPPAGPERIARVLAPAISRWLATKGKEPAVSADIAARFPGLTTPARGFPVITGDFSLRDGKPIRHHASGD
ncbi:MAG TPA: MraY family glycosyltransferase [Gemmatimonadaceae bacterium]|nr:MraY family glycosyltransferase [Gemmatimonadaceae bacterium]